MSYDKSDDRMNSKEALSSAIDGEVSEFLLRRILKESEHDQDIGAQWERYHMISSVIKGELEPIKFHDISAAVMIAVRDNNTPQNTASEKTLTPPTGEVIPFKVVKPQINTSKPPGIKSRWISLSTAAACATIFFSWQYLSVPDFTPTQAGITEQKTTPAEKAVIAKTEKKTPQENGKNNAALKLAAANNDTNQQTGKMKNINGKEVWLFDGFDISSDPEAARASNNYWLIHHGAQGFKASSAGVMPYSRMINWQMSQLAQPEMTTDNSLIVR